MTATVGEVLAVLDRLAPARLAEDWDNVGLQVGDPAWPAGQIMIALDPTAAVVDEAIRRRADLLVTHHPLIFRPLRQVNLATHIGRLIDRLITGRVAVISAHTNLDSVQGGINDVLVDMLALQNPKVLQAAAAEADAGLGRVGELPQPCRFEELVEDIKRRMGLAQIRYAGHPPDPVKRVAVCSGSGGGLVATFLESTAEVFVTGDVRYHDAREIEAHQRGIIDIGHFESERIIVRELARRLTARLEDMSMRAVVTEAECEATPFKHL
jgi:dinuclear metal center YbgI/SA1388 family protein